MKLCSLFFLSGQDPEASKQLNQTVQDNFAFLCNKGANVNLSGNFCAREIATHSVIRNDPFVKILSCLQFSTLILIISCVDVFEKFQRDFPKKLSRKKVLLSKTCNFCRWSSILFCQRSETAAATAARLTACSRPTTKTVCADLPFAYWIAHLQTGAVLFSGLVANPQSNWRWLSSRTLPFFCFRESIYVPPAV